MPKTEDEIEKAVLQFYGHESFGMRSTRYLSDEELRSMRGRSNIERPSFYGAQLHALLTTCAVLRTEIDALRGAVPEPDQGTD